MGNVQDIAAVAEKAVIKRTMHTFTVPETLVAEVGVAKISVSELTAEEEMMATRRSGGDQVRLVWELAKESLRRIDDMPVSTGNGTVDAHWNRMHPKLRQMVIGAYNSVHSPDRDESKAFLGSREIEVG